MAPLLLIGLIAAAAVFMRLSVALNGGDSGMMDNLWDFLTGTWPGQLISALFCWVLAAMYYSDIGRRVPPTLLGLILGPLVLALVWGCLGALFTVVGIWNLVDRVLYGKSDESDDE